MFSCFLLFDLVVWIGCRSRVGRHRYCQILCYYSYDFLFGGCFVWILGPGHNLFLIVFGFWCLMYSKFEHLDSWCWMFLIWIRHSGSGFLFYLQTNRWGFWLNCVWLVGVVWFQFCWFYWFVFNFAAMQSQLVCNGCRSLLLYPRGATNVCCALCNTITSVPPPGKLINVCVTGILRLENLQVIFRCVAGLCYLLVWANYSIWNKWGRLG